MHEQKLHPEGFLDILEKRYEEEPEVISKDDMWDLYRSGRISREEFLASDRTPHDENSRVPPQDEMDSLMENYGFEEAGLGVDKEEN